MNILLTSVGRRSYLVKYFQKALNGKGEVHVANSTDISPAFHVADQTVVTPLIYDEKYISFLKKYCVDNKIDAIIPLFDVDLPVLAVNKKEFEKIGTTLIVSDYSAVEICNDKWKMYQFLQNEGINTPKTFLSRKKALDSIASGEISYPIMIKPRWGMGSIAVFEAENEEELQVFEKKARKAILESYLKYESSVDIENSILFQEKLEGKEFGLDIINDLQGNYMTTIPKMKYSMRSGETDCAVTVENQELLDLGHRLAKALHHIANLDADVFLSNGKYFVLELNARFGGGYPFSHMAGVDLPQAIVKWIRREPVSMGLLTARINVMSHKDIGLVRVYHNFPQMDVVRVTSFEKVRALLLVFGQFLIPPLRERPINIDEYAEKIFKFGVMYAAYDLKGKCHGILALYMNDQISRRAYITIFSLESNSRGHGLGGRILRQAENDAIKCGMQSLWLEAKKKNYNAIGFYQSHGYSMQEDISEDSCYMRKILCEE